MERLMRSDLLCFFVSHAFAHEADRRVFHEHLQVAWPKNGVYRVLEPSQRHHEQHLEPKEVATLLRQRIAEADVVLVAAARYAVRRPWMLFEVGTARELKKPIILVRRPGVRCPVKLVNLCGVQPTELDTLRWKITRLLPAERLGLLRAKELEQARTPGSSSPRRSASAEHNLNRYPWLLTLRSIAEDWPKAE